MTLVDLIERVDDGENLLANLKLIRPGSWQNSQEVFRAWTQENVPVEGVSTANLAVYRLDENGEAVFELLGREGNPIMDEALREDAYNGILQNEFFFPQGRMKEQINAAGAKVTISYSGLQMKFDGYEKTNYGYVEFTGRNSHEERILFEAVYGTANPGNGKRVFLLRKEAVEAQLKNKPGNLFVGACYLNDNRDFGAEGIGIGNFYSAVCGVRLEKGAEGDTLQIVPENNYINTRVLASLVEYMGILAGVGGVVSSLQNGFDSQEGLFIITGAVAFTAGKALNSVVYRDQLNNVLSRALNKILL